LVSAELMRVSCWEKSAIDSTDALSTAHSTALTPEL
jgi:hypothetical protein